jgi:hypothetical protein
MANANGQECVLDSMDSVQANAAHTVTVANAAHAVTEAMNNRKPTGARCTFWQLTSLSQGVLVYKSYVQSQTYLLDLVHASATDRQAHACSRPANTRALYQACSAQKAGAKNLV